MIFVNKIVAYKTYLNECIKHFLALFRTIDNACIILNLSQVGVEVPQGLSSYYWQPEASLIKYVPSSLIHISL